MHRCGLDAVEYKHTDVVDAHGICVQLHTEAHMWWTFMELECS